MKKPGDRVVTKPAPRNKQLREKPLMSLNVATVFKDTSGHAKKLGVEESAEQLRIRKAREKRERKRARQ